LTKRDYNIEVDIKETGYDVVGWIYVIWDRDKYWDAVNAIMNNRTHKNCEEWNEDYLRVHGYYMGYTYLPLSLLTTKICAFYEH
jgi:hypothetical protein